MQTIINGSGHPYMTDIGEHQNALPRWGTIHHSGYPQWTALGSLFVTAARAVGYALSALAQKREPAPSVPWQRVINSQGRISTPNMDGGADLQAALLRAEGVAVSDDLRVDLGLYLWEGLHLVEIDDILAGRA